MYICPISIIIKYPLLFSFFFFFFQAEDGIRDVAVTGVQTCALPIFADLVLELQHKPLGGLAPHAADPGQRGQVLTPDRRHESLGRQAREDVERETRADPADADQGLEQASLARGREAVQGQLVLADMEVRDERGFLPLGRQRFVGRKRDRDAPADPADLHRHFVDRLTRQAPAERADHDRAPFEAPGPRPSRSPAPALAPRFRWQSATARLSVASLGTRPAGM